MGTVALALVAVACGGDDEGGGNPGAGGQDGGGQDGGGGPVPICTDGTRWAAGTPVFTESAARRGLAGVLGTRLTAVDFDGDGWPDLLVRRAGDVADDLSEGGARRTWLMRNKGDGTFEDVTPSSGLLQNRTETNPDLGRPGTVYAFGDVDNDGDLDAYVGKSDDPSAMPASPETSELLVNDGDGTFSLGPADSALRVSRGDSPAGAAFADVDRNGTLDLWVTRSINLQPRQDALYVGDGAGGFVDVTTPAGLNTRPWTPDDLNRAASHTVAWGALACDLNDDGNLELLSSSYGRAPNHLWQAVGTVDDQKYANISIASGYAFDARVDWADNESARCHCQLNPMDADCAGVPGPAFIQCVTQADAFRWNHAQDRNPFRLGGNSGATMCGDVDNDGDMDLLTSEIVHWDVGTSSDPSELLLNTGAADIAFERPGNSVTGLTRDYDIVSWNDGDITGAIFDFDNDGWPDIYIGSTDYPEAKGWLYHQVSSGVFEPVPIAEGIDQHRSHGIAIADFDRDGDLDAVVGHSRARCSGAGGADCYPDEQVRFFENTYAQAGNWFQVELAGVGTSNRAAIGARVTVVAEDGTTQTQEIGGGHGHYGAQHDLTLHFGLGTACRAQVTVRWPDAELTTETHDLVSGYRYQWMQFETPTVAP